MSRPRSRARTDAAGGAPLGRSGVASERSPMSTLLFKLGHLASRHPWRVVAAWLVVAVSVFP